MRFDKLLVFLCLGVWPGLGAEAMSGARAGDDATSLVDVTQGSFYDGWGREAVRTLTSYYSGGSEGAVQMLDYRASFLPVLDWAEGRIETEVGGDLYGFYASGGGAGRVQYEEDPAYAFTYQARYQEPAGRLSQTAGAGYALGMGAPQGRIVASDYQNWNDAGLGSASGIAGAGLESIFNTTSSYGGFGADLTTFTQGVRDARGVTSLSRQAWQTSGSQTTDALWSGRMVSFDQALPSNLTPPTGVGGAMSSVRQRQLGNYFAGEITGQSGFNRTEAEVDVLGQWGFGYDPNLAGSAHVFRDDRGRVRFFRSNADLSNKTSQGFRYLKYDSWGRLIEMGVLLNVAESSFADYAAWARQADLDEQLTSANSCPVFTIAYDSDPVTGSLAAYDERRGAIARKSYYPTAIDDQPTSCPGRGTSDPVNESLYQYDDLGRTQLLSEHRQGTDSNVYRTTGRQWTQGGLLSQLAYPDEDQEAAFVTGTVNLTLWPDVMGRTLRQCAGADCSGTIYADVTKFDWMSSPLTVVAGNRVSTTTTYDLRGRVVGTSASLGDNVLFAETLRDMQFKDGENPCPGSTASPDYAAGLIIARALSGSGLPEEDQGIWECYSYDGAARLSQTSRYQGESGNWAETQTYAYDYDANGNVESITESAEAGGLEKLLPGLLDHAPQGSDFARRGPQAR